MAVARLAPIRVGECRIQFGAKYLKIDCRPERFELIAKEPIQPKGIRNAAGNLAGAHAFFTKKNPASL
jgi:hypothetical protein